MIPGGNGMGNMMMPMGMGMTGGRHETEGDANASMPDGKITSFAYNRKGYALSIRQQENGSFQYTARGGSIYDRDGSQFRIELDVQDEELCRKLEDIIRAYNLYRNNGHTVQVDGLPDGLGDHLSVEFDSGEKIYKASNQGILLSDEEGNAIYEVFRNEARRHGYDFNTAGSNMQLYDDATVEYLQGTWTGEHFGAPISAAFTGTHVVITVKGEVSDDTEYVIVNGVVKPARLKEGITSAKNEYDYENFSYCTGMRKKNAFTIYASVYRDKASSTFELKNFRK